MDRGRQRVAPHATRRTAHYESAGASPQSCGWEGGLARRPLRASDVARRERRTIREGKSRSVASQKLARAKPDNQVQGRESVGHVRGARREIDTMQTFEPHHVVHKSFTGLCTTAVLDDSIRLRDLLARGRTIAMAQAGSDPLGASARQHAERDFTWCDRAVTTASDVGASAEAGLGKFYGTSA